MARRKSPPRTSRARKPAAKGAAAGVPLKPALELIRERIDAIDAELHGLINERALLAQQVGIS